MKSEIVMAVKESFKQVQLIKHQFTTKTKANSAIICLNIVNLNKYVTKVMYTKFKIL